MDRRSILIVEDEPSIAEVVALYLKRAGFQTMHWPPMVDGSRSCSSGRRPTLASSTSCCPSSMAFT